MNESHIQVFLFLKRGFFGLKKAKSRGTTIHGDLYDLLASQARKREVGRTFEGTESMYGIFGSLVFLLPSIVFYLFYDTTQFTCMYLLYN